MFRGKKYKDSAKQIDRAVQYEPADALGLVVKTAPAKFDETVEIHIKLGVDSRHADQQVRCAVVLPNGTGKIEITGSLGDVMKESAQLAVTYAKVHAEEYGITPDKFKNTDLHIHAPEGAVPKDGPSAGVTLTTALISALSGIPVNHDLAMTGEITLHGNVLPIGGLKEKSMAAFREGISTVLIPRDNASDLYEVDAEVKEKVRFIPVGTLSEVLKHALVRPGRTPARAVRGVPQATSLIANDKPAEGHKEPAAVM